MTKPDKLTVIRCTPRRDGSFLVLLKEAGSATSDVAIGEGKRVRVADGRVVEICA